jgi:hypothetical protein
MGVSAEIKGDMSRRLADLTIAILVVTALGTGCGDDDPSSPPPPPPTPTQIGFTVQPRQALRDSVIALEGDTSSVAELC